MPTIYSINRLALTPPRRAVQLMGLGSWRNIARRVRIPRVGNFGCLSVFNLMSQAPSATRDTWSLK